MNWLETLASLASIITAIVAVYAYGRYRFILRSRRKRIETALEAKSEPNDDTLTVQQIAADNKMTEEQVVEAAAASDKIAGWGGLSGDERRLKFIGKPKSN